MPVPTWDESTEIAEAPESAPVPRWEDSTPEPEPTWEQSTPEPDRPMARAPIVPIPDDAPIPEVGGGIPLAQDWDALRAGLEQRELSKAPQPTFKEALKEGWQASTDELPNTVMGIPGRAMALIPKPTAQQVQDAFDVMAASGPGPHDLGAPSRPPTEAAKATAGAVNVARSVPETFSTPVGFSTLGMGALPQLAQRAVSAAFLAETLAHTPEAAQRAGAASVEGDTQEKVEAYGGLASIPAFAIPMALHAGGPGSPPVPPRIEAVIKENAHILPKAAEAAAKVVSKDVGQQLEKPVAPEPVKPSDTKVSTPPANDTLPPESEVSGIGSQKPEARSQETESPLTSDVRPPTSDLTLDAIMATEGTGLSSAELGLANRSPKGIATLDRLSKELADRRAKDKANAQLLFWKNRLDEAGRVARDQIQDEPILQEQVASVQKRLAAKEIPDDWQISVTPEQELPEGGEKMPGNVQVVDPGQTDTSKSPTLESLRAAGYNVPDFQSLPKGKYTVKQAREMLAPKPESAAAAPPPTAATVAGKPATPTKPADARATFTARPGTEGAIPPKHTPPGAATPADIPETGVPEKETHGIAARVREQRRQQGVAGPVEPGKGIGAEESVEHGRELLASGRDPEAVLTAFERTNALSAEDMAVVRAHSERLAREAREAAAEHGVNSPEYEAAWEKGFEWDKRTKPMQTEWHKIGMAQQGEVEIDTGTFHGLRRAYNDATGRDFTPDQAKTAKGKAEKVAEADKNAAVAKTHLYNELDRQASATAAEARAIEAANKTHREAVARAAAGVTKARVREAAAQKELDRLRNSPADDAKQAVHTAHQAIAARAAKAERVAAIKKAVMEKKAAEAARRVAERKAEKANAALRAAAVKAAKAVTKERVAKADLPSYVWSKAREYIENGMDDFNDVRNKLATDLGMSVDKVTAAMGKARRAKFLADDLWRKQQTARMMKSQAKRWVTQTALPKYLRALQSVPRILFSLKVGFHGTVALGTHAPMVAFQPPFWKTYIRDFGKMYKMVGSKAYYEMQVQDLIRRKNYITARRAGLVNDPFTYEDFNSPDTAKYFGNLTGMGNRGYAVLKILRQDMFDQQWNSLPRTAQVPEVAKAIADGLNHATGVVKGRAPAGANLALFAPRLEASRVAWLAADPVKALKSFADWKNATQGEKVFAINQIKEKAWVAGTLFSLLAINQGLLWAADSKQKVNFTDPLKSDFLKFKAAGMDVSYGNAMLSMARLPVRLYAIREGTGGKTKALVHPDESSYTVLGEYVRSQLSPFASLASSLWFKSDWQNRPLPSSNRPVPKRLAAQGAKPYTWPEFWIEQFLPIPFEEAMREVWGHGMGMNPDQIDHMLKAMATISVMGATGGRVVEDRSLLEAAK